MAVCDDDGTIGSLIAEDSAVLAFGSSVATVASLCSPVVDAVVATDTDVAASVLCGFVGVGIPFGSSGRG